MQKQKNHNSSLLLSTKTILPMRLYHKTQLSLSNLSTTDVARISVSFQSCVTPILAYNFQYPHIVISNSTIYHSLFFTDIDEGGKTYS